MNDRLKRVRTDQRRRTILASASRAIRRHGLQGAGMRQIAQAAGLSPGNLYYYFRNKHELVFSCQEQSLDLLLDVARDAQAERRTVDALVTLVRGHLGVLLDAGAAGALHLELSDLPAPLYKKIVHKRDQYERAVRELIATGQRRGEVKGGDPKLQAFALLGALNWAARWFDPAGSWTIEQVADSFVEQLLGGLVR